MQSKLETILMTNVGTYVRRFIWWAFGWGIHPVIDTTTKLCHDISILFFDKHEELIGFDDNQLSMLGLDMSAVNDGERYWDYTTRDDRGNGRGRNTRLFR